MSGYINIPAYGSANWKDPVAAVINLPASGNSTGDARVVQATNQIYVWSGSAWVLASGSAGANTFLSNLTSPTAINQSLLFNPDATHDIGADGASRPGGIHASNHVTAPTVRGRDNVSGMGQHDITVRGGNGTTGNKDGGLLTLAGGVASGTGTNGNIVLKTANLDRLTINATGDVLVPNYIVSPQLYDAGTFTGAISLNWANGPAQKITVNAAGPLAITLTNPVTGGAYLIKIVQGATPGTVTWPGTVKWGTAGAPTLSTATGKIDIINLYWDGTNYFGTYALGF